jgi:ADP-ribosylglycohydrolase
MPFPTAGGPFFRHLRMWHAVPASLVVVAVVAFLVLLPSDGTPSVPNSPCRPADSAREDTPGTPDLDGDGFVDLVHEISDTENFDVIVVPGSEHGPDHDRTTVLTHDDLGVPDDIQTGDDPWQPTVADLDEDGHADLVVSGVAQVLWGGLKGPQARGPHGRVPLPGSGYSTAPIAGDFDGDGHTDLAVFRFSNKDQELIVLKGPFKRSGAPALTVEIPSPVHEGASPVLVAGDANDDRATDLALYDSPWDPPLLFTGGARTAGGLSKEPERLPEGEMCGGGGWDPGEATDDTQMAVLVAESLLERGGLDLPDIFARFQRWAASEPKDIGLQTEDVLANGMPWDLAAAIHFQVNQRAAGNGALMRASTSAVHFAAAGQEATMDAARRIAALTHGDRAAWEGTAIFHELIRVTFEDTDPLAALPDILALVHPEHRGRYATVLAPAGTPIRRPSSTVPSGPAWAPPSGPCAPPPASKTRYARQSTSVVTRTPSPR